MDKDTARAILIANLKGDKIKRSPLLTIAEAVHVLVEDEGYGAYKKLAKEFDVTRSDIASFDRMLKHPPAIKKLIEKGEILIDASTKLASIRDTSRRIELAKVVAGMSAFDTRYIIDYAKKHPELTAEECKKAVLGSKAITRELHAVVVPLEAELFIQFKNKADRKGLKLEEAAKIAVQSWLHEKGGHRV